MGKLEGVSAEICRGWRPDVPVVALSVDLLENKYLLRSNIISFKYLLNGPKYTLLEFTSMSKRAQGTLEH